MSGNDTDASNPGSNVPQSASIQKQIEAEALRFANLGKNLKDATLELIGGAETLNKAFLGARLRMSEFVDRINEANPKMAALGAESKDVYNTIAQIAVGTRRQVIASTEDLMSVFAASEVTGEKVDALTEKFAQVGYNYTQIGSNVLQSVNLVQSLGLNAKVIMGDVLKNTEQLSRFNFQEGVQGLTRMAAQASMLRFDMNQTFQLAEKVLDPDQAVSVASAFQRLGVAAGNLVDPLALLNQSLTDPSGLQDSLINVARQFTYFDEQTKSFKINPQGILTLREMEAQTGVSAKSMRDAALAAADMDKRLAALSQLNISKEFSQDDKNLLANISTFKDGVLQIRVSKPGETEQFKELKDLTMSEAKSLVEEQKNAPKTIEDLQRRQLGTGEKALAELRRLNATMAQSVIGIPGYSNQLLETSGQIRDTFGALTESLYGPEFQARFEKEYQKIKTATTEEERDDAIEQFKDKMKSFLPELTQNLGTELGTFTMGTFGNDFFKEYLKDLPLQLGVGKVQKVSGVGPDAGPNTVPPRRTRAVYGAGPTASNNTINLAELMSRVTSQQRAPITVNQTNNYNQTNNEVSQPFAKDFFQNLGRQDIEKLKKMLEDVQNATGQ